jgi:hypothetical protein
MTKRKTLGAWRCVLAAAALLPVAVLGQQPQAADPAAQEVDQNIQKLKEQALDINQQALRVEEDFLYPASNRVSVYVGVLIPGMLISDISVSIDGGEPIRYPYTAKESQTLQDGGLHLLKRLSASPGSHRIHAEFIAKYSGTKSSDPPFTGSYDGSFDKADLPVDLELALVRVGYLTKPELKLRNWRPAS